MTQLLQTIQAQIDQNDAAIRLAAAIRDPKERLSMLDRVEKNIDKTLETIRKPIKV